MSKVRGIAIKTPVTSRKKAEPLQWTGKIQLPSFVTRENCFKTRSPEYTMNDGQAHCHVQALFLQYSTRKHGRAGDILRQGWRSCMVKRTVRYIHYIRSSIIASYLYSEEQSNKSSQLAIATLTLLFSPAFHNSFNHPHQSC